MDLFSEFRTAVQSDLTVGAESSLFDLTTIDLAINRVYKKIGGMFKWPYTRDALKTSTEVGAEYYDYPTTWRPESCWRIEVDGEDYGDPLSFSDYLYEKENDFPSGIERVFANHGNKFFLYPVPTAAGDNNISIWGYKSVDALVNPTDYTIFSYSMPEVNEAIVLEAVAVLKSKGNILQIIRRLAISGPEMLSQEARGIVANAWLKISQEKQKFEYTTPGFNVPDFFANGIRNRDILRNKIGQF